MLANSLTPVNRTYDRRAFTANRGVFSVEATALTAPQTLEIAHKKRADGTIDSVIIITSDKKDAVTNIVSRVKTQLKISYNPASSRNDIEGELLDQIGEITAAMTANFPSILNREV